MKSKISHKHTRNDTNKIQFTADLILEAEIKLRARAGGGRLLTGGFIHD